MIGVDDNIRLNLENTVAKLTIILIIIISIISTFFLAILF